MISQGTGHVYIKNQDTNQEFQYHKTASGGRETIRSSFPLNRTPCEQMIAVFSEWLHITPQRCDTLYALQMQSVK